jgi:UDPglucose 6-dehydrogenase
MLHDTTLRHADPLIAILGLAYKENTNSTKNSAAIRLVRHLLPFRLRVFDPSVGGAAISFHRRAEVASDALSACRDADALCIMTPWPAFRNLRVPALAQLMHGRILIDPYGIIDVAAARACGFDHRILGRHTNH